MNAFPFRMAAALAVALFAAACARINDWSRQTMDAVTPYRVEVVQGNFVSREQVAALKPGMSRAQVREILGTPLLTSVFHDARWDYVFTIRRQGVAEQSRRLSVFFDGDGFARSEGDELPSEEEFVAAISRPASTAAVPNLQASSEQLAAAAEKSPKKSEQNPAQNQNPQPRVSYPPLE